MRKLRIINPAPTRSTSVRANSATTIVDDETTGADCAGAAPASFFQDLVHVGLGNLQSWREAENDAGGEADRREIGEHERIELEDDPVRFADVRDRGVEQPDADCARAQGRRSRRDTPAGCSRRAAAGRFATGSRRVRSERRFHAFWSRSARAAGLRRWRMRSAARSRLPPEARERRRGWNRR